MISFSSTIGIHPLRSLKQLSSDVILSSIYLLLSGGGPTLDTIRIFDTHFTCNNCTTSDDHFPTFRLFIH